MLIKMSAQQERQFACKRLIELDLNHSQQRGNSMFKKCLDLIVQFYNAYKFAVHNDKYLKTKQ